MFLNRQFLFKSQFLSFKMFNLTVDKYARYGDFVGNASTQDSATAIKIYNKVHNLLKWKWQRET